MISDITNKLGEMSDIAKGKTRKIPKIPKSKKRLKQKSNSLVADTFS